MRLTIAEQMMLSTVRIEVQNSSNEPQMATGVLFAFPGRNSDHIHSIITCRHILSQCKSIRILYQSWGKTDISTRDTKNFCTFDSCDVIFHPNNQIDLAAIPIPKEIIQNKTLGTFLDCSFIPDTLTWSKFDAIEELIMIGYPFGLMDSKHNLPILRRGITGTHPAYDYCGNPNFLADMACYNGSSGSPVFLYDTNLWKNRSSEREVHPLLMGIQTHGFFISQETETCLHLGKVVKSTQLLDFAPGLLASR